MKELLESIQNMAMGLGIGAAVSIFITAYKKNKNKSGKTIAFVVFLLTMIFAVTIWWLRMLAAK